MAVAATTASPAQLKICVAVALQLATASATAADGPCASPIAVGSVTEVARRWPARRRRYLAAALAASALLCASCGSDDGSTAAAAADDDIDVEVRPFAEVQASDFVFEADPTDPTGPGRARISRPNDERHSRRRADNGMVVFAVTQAGARRHCQKQDF